MVVIHRPRETGDEPRPRAEGSLDYAAAYRQLCRAARCPALGAGPSSVRGGAAVLLLATPSVDSLAATRQFTRLLAEDEIAFRVAPVNGYRALQKVLAEDVHGHAELHTLVFLNLGSLLDLPTTIPLPPHCTLHVLDSHRPWNLSNLFATSQLNDRLYIWDDGEIDERLQRERDAFERLEFDVSDDEEDEGDEDGEDGGDAEEYGKGEDADDAEEDAAHGEHARMGGSASPRASPPILSSPPAKRRRRTPPAGHLSSDARELYRMVLSKYYSRGSSLGMSTAQMVYMLAVSLGRSDRDSLWCAILGLSAQYVANEIDAATYDGYAAALASDVAAFARVTDEPSAERSGLQDVNLYGADDASIRVVPEELRFTLYRNWSLEASMYHTGYVAAKLGTWREKGMSKLRGLLAKMGLSLANCRQIYEHMDLDLKDSLVARVESIAPEYGLTDLVFRSFTRSCGFRAMPISASDAVEGISALLQAAHGVRIEIDGVQVIQAARLDNPGSGSVSSYGGRTLWHLPRIDLQTSGRERTEREDAALDPALDAGTLNGDADSSAGALWVQNFFEAYRAMDATKTPNVVLLQSSLQLAKALHEAIVSQGISVITKQSIKTLKTFRLAILQEGPTLQLFTQPDTLARLGNWLIDALRDIVSEQHARRPRRKGEGDARAVSELPFVLAALDAPRAVFVVVGIVGSADYGGAVRNRFGLAFQDAAAKSGARMRNDRFDASVLEVQREDLMAFVEALHLGT
ncbi:DNA replication initiation factor cdc45 [Malassezia sp. CBS 17886]|nr:DNA replication initiation factor cdc45 [Malassezia sp. CBS 17886]